MKAKTIWVKQLINKGNYEHEELGIEIQLENGDNTYEIIQKTRNFILNILKMEDNKKELKYLKDKLNNDNLTIREYNIIKQKIKDMELKIKAVEEQNKIFS